MNQASSSIALGTGSATVMFGALSLNDWAIIIGIVCTVGTFALNWHYKRQEFKLKQEQAHIGEGG